MKWIKTKLLAGGIMLLSASVPAQIRTVSGTVLEKTPNGNSNPLTGAVLETPNHEFGTQTDSLGNFEWQIPDSFYVLIASFIGYQSDTLKLQPGNNRLKITLQQPKNLKEYVLRKRQKGTTINSLDPIKKETIGERELLKAACCNLSESFETTPSVDVAFTDAVTGYKQIQMLGLAGPYTLITRENIPDVRGLAAVTGLTFTPGSWIESMQLSKGTGSVVNGYESVAGQINVELKKPFEEKEEKWNLNFYQSTQGRTEGNLVYRKQFNEKLSTNLFLHGKSQWMKTDQNKDGFLDQPNGNQFIGLNRWFFFGKKGLEIQGGVKGTYADNIGGQWQYKKGTEQIAGNPWGFEMVTKRAEGWAKIGKVFPAKPATSMGLQISALYHEQEASYGKRDYNASQKSFYANYIFQSIISNSNHVIKLGLSNLYDEYQETFNSIAYNRTEIVPGAFAEYAFTHSDKFNLVAGIRGDYHNVFGAFVTPRLHVRYAPFKKTTIRASVGRAQRTANILTENIGSMASNRSFVINSTDPKKPYGLDPEVAWNTGLNLTQKFILNYNDGSFFVDYYYTDFQNQVVVDIENAHSVRFYNLDGQSFAHSLQMQLDYELIHNLDMRIAYRWYDVKTTFSDTLKAKPLVAAHRAFVNLGYETRKKWKFDYTIQWVGQKRVPTHHTSHGWHEESYSPSFFQMNAQISKSFNEKFEVYVGGENLTNYMQHEPVLNASNPYADGFDASIIWGPVMGRNVYAGFRWKIF